MFSVMKRLNSHKYDLISGIKVGCSSRTQHTAFYAQSGVVNNNNNTSTNNDRLCGLVVRVSGYRYRGPGFDPRRYQIF